MTAPWRIWKSHWSGRVSIFAGEERIMKRADPSPKIFWNAQNEAIIP